MTDIDPRDDAVLEAAAVVSAVANDMRLRRTGNAATASITITGGGALSLVMLMFAMLIAGASGAALFYSSRDVSRLEQRTDMLEAYQQQNAKRDNQTDSRLSALEQKATTP